MNADRETTRSLWVQSSALASPPALHTAIKCDVAVVGGGITGLSVAYEAMKAGRSVALVDRGPLGGGMTARTTAHLASSLDDYYHELIKTHDKATASLYGHAQMAAIDRIEEIVAQEAIACDFRRLNGYLVLAEPTDPAILDRELEACHEIGLTDVSRVDYQTFPGAMARPALRFPRQARFHVLDYLSGLVAALEKGGARLFANTAVMSVKEENGRVRIECEGGGSIDAEAAVVATNGPINDHLALHSKLAPYRTYAMAFRIPAGSVNDALVWDTLDPYHYVRVQEAGGSLALIVGGEDHKSGEASDQDRRFESLISWTRENYPMVGAELARWSGQVMEPIDFMPFSGRNPGNTRVFVHTGDSGQGMTNGVLGAMLIADLILGRENPLAAVCEPSRKPVMALRDFVAENLTVVKNYAERLMPGEVSSVDDVAPGQGALIRSGLSRLAVYRDPGGPVHVMSANCTHAGCIVHWNPLESCWDCPCHGSQFAPDGAVLNGPATTALEPAEPPAASGG